MIAHKAKSQISRKANVKDRSRTLRSELAKCKRQLSASGKQIKRLARENANLREDFRDLFEEAPIAYVHEGVDSRFIRANRAAMRLLGIKAEEVSETFGKTLVAENLDTQRRLREAFTSIGTGKLTGGVELELRRKDNGVSVWVQWWSKPDPGGKFTRTMMVDITDRVRIAQTKAALEFSLESGQVGEWDLDVINDTSRRSLRHDQCFGYDSPIPDGDWGSEKFLQHVHDEDRARVKKTLRDAIDTLQDWASEFRVVWPNASVHWLAARGRVYKATEGKATRMLGIVMDITDRKSAEETLRETKAALEFALTSGQIGDWDLNLINDTSRRSLRHDQCFGYNEPVPEADWGIEAFSHHLHPDDRERVVASLRGAARDLLEDWSSEFRVVWRDGSVHWLNARGAIYRTSEGKATRMLGIVMDITDRKHAEAEAQRIERYLNDAQRLSRTGSFVVNFTTKEHLWSQETYRIYEYELGLQATAELVLARVHPDDRAALKANFDRRSLREPLDIRYRLLLPDGRLKDIRVLGRPIESSSPGATYAGALMDVTEAKLAEDALRASEQLSRAQVETLKSTLDALAIEPSPSGLLKHILRTIAEQTGAQSLSVWCQDETGAKIELESVYEDDRVIPKDDPRFARVETSLTIADVWPWPEVFHTGKPSLIEDIRNEPSFPMRDRLLPLGVISVLLVPMSVGGRYHGAIGLRFMEKRKFRPEEMELAQALANQAMLIIQFTRLSEQSREAAVIAERNRIARDMHDTLAQGFTGVIVQLEAAEDAKLRGFPKEADEHLVRARELARDSLNEARRSVSALRPQALDQSNFSDALARLLSKMTKGTSLTAEFTMLGNPQPLPSDWEENLFRVGQEILTNALRHAQASRFTAKLVFAPDQIQLNLRDDGRGFDPSVKNDGYGLLGIRERVEGMGGEFALRSAIGNGTAISITLPIPKLAETHTS